MMFPEPSSVAQSPHRVAQPPRIFFKPLVVRPDPETLTPVEKTTAAPLEREIAPLRLSAPPSVRKTWRPGASVMGGLTDWLPAEKLLIEPPMIVPPRLSAGVVRKSGLPLRVKE